MGFATGIRIQDITQYVALCLSAPVCTGLWWMMLSQSFSPPKINNPLTAACWKVDWLPVGVQVEVGGYLIAPRHGA